jgi:hypothetical protein
MKLCLHCLVRIDGVVLDLARGLLSLYRMFLNSILILTVLSAFAKFRKATVSLRLSICSSVLSAWSKSAPTGRIFMKSGIWVFFENLSRKFKYFTKDQCTFFLSHLAEYFLEWELFHANVVEKIESHILRSITFFRKPCRLWDNV